MRYNVTEAEFHHFRMEGCGMIFAHLNNRLHTADCETLQYQANAYKKRLFDDLEEATSWLNSHRPGWQNCPVCYHLRDRHRRAEVGKRRGTRGRTSGAHAGS